MKHKKEDLQEIPKTFYSFIDEKPFENCADCGKGLLNNNTEYLIERVYRNHKEYKTSEVIFDYAICMDCAMRLHQEMSNESKQKLQQFFQSNLNLEKRNQLIRDKKSIEESLSTCLVSGDDLVECEEYQVCAHCVGDKVFMGNPPYMISGKILDRIMHLLSNETQDILNGFYDKIRTPSPGIYEPDPKLVLF